MKSMTELAEIIGNVLNEQCQTRFECLMGCKDGWGGRDEKAMRLDSANEFVEFILQYTSIHSLNANDVGIFFNDEGYVSTSWHGTNHTHLIEIVFVDSKIQVYTDDYELEGDIKLDGETNSNLLNIISAY